MQQLILDLRYNSGGYMSAAVEIVDKFLSGDKLIVYTKGRTPSSFQEYYSDDEQSWDGPLIVLVNYESASAAEIVASAIQDWDRGIVAGEMTFGKGLVQTQYRFRNGDALLLTTSRWYPPSGRSVQRPYKLWGDQDEYYEGAYDLEKRSHFDFLPKSRTAGGRVVLGDNGVVPDTTLSSGKMFGKEIRKVIDHPRRILTLFAENYVREHTINGDIETFMSNFTIDNSVLIAFKDTVAQIDSALGAKVRYKKFNDDLRMLIKREIAYAKFGIEGYWKLDSQLRSAVGVFKSKILTRK